MPSALVQGPLWGAKADVWAELAEPAQQPFYEAAFDAIAVDENTRLLDVGCGAGLALELAAKRGATVAGVDAAERLVDIARSRLPDADIRVGDLEQLPFPDGFFTAATYFNAVQYTTDPRRALTELARVIEPGSPVVVVTWADPARSQMRDVLAAVGGLLPPPPPGAGGPFALSLPGALENLVQSAGLTPRAAGEVQTPYEYVDVNTAVRAQSSSGPAVRAAQYAGEQALQEAVGKVMQSHRRTDGSPARQRLPLSRGDDLKGGNLSSDPRAVGRSSMVHPAQPLEPLFRHLNDDNRAAPGIGVASAGSGEEVPMTSIELTAADERRVETFAEALFTAALATMELANVDLGVRLGLYEALWQHGPQTSAELADATGTVERYVREWLEQQAVAGVLEVDPAQPPATRRFTLPAAHAHVLLDDDSEACMKPCAAIAPWVGRSVEIMTEEFRRGTGVAFGAFGLHDLQAAFNRPVFANHLVQDWLPALPDVQAQLSAGSPVRIAEVGCGTGFAALLLAEAYPQVRVDGFDLDEASIRVAREAAEDRGLSDRVHFEVRDAADPTIVGHYDLVLAIEMIHDVPHPVSVLHTMRTLPAPMQPYWSSTSGPNLRSPSLRTPQNGSSTASARCTASPSASRTTVSAPAPSCVPTPSATTPNAPASPAWTFSTSTIHSSGSTACPSGGLLSGQAQAHLLQVQVIVKDRRRRHGTQPLLRQTDPVVSVPFDRDIQTELVQEVPVHRCDADLGRDPLEHVRDPRTQLGLHRLTTLLSEHLEPLDKCLPG